MSVTMALLFVVTLSTERESPSDVILPPQRMGLKFNHKFHVDDLALACAKCHTEAPASLSSRDKLIPKEEVCAGCHEDTNRETGDCTKCHVSKSPASLAEIPAPNLNFPHKTHVEKGIDCVRCHAGVPAVELATREHLPRMSLCLTCHDNRTAPDDCTTCHLGAGGGRVRLRYAAGTLKPRNHDGEWFRTHRAVGRMDDRQCRACHQEADCMDCHRGGRLTRGAAIKPNFHPNDWVATHGRAAYADDPTCSSCHARETFCRDCHTGYKVTDLTLPGERQFHPIGWVDFQVPSEHHSHQARRNVAPCAACHAEETCLRCHSTKTLRFNPHPRGFEAAALVKQNRVMCERCHDPSDPKLR